MIYHTPAGAAPRLYRDMLKQPHVLIAGTTGSGKSTAINGIIYTALYSAPGDVSFVLIDTKCTELSPWRCLPHTVRYISRAEDAPGLLADVLAMTRRRAQEAAAQGLKTYNGGDVYVVIDELGDLIFSERETVGLLGQLAMLGRAARVHLIAGTQCPNRKTLSAEFAANMPARLGLRCQDRIESRQIVGTPDCIRLPMYGVGLYRCPAYRDPVPVTVPMIPDEELKARARWWERQR